CETRLGAGEYFPRMARPLYGVAQSAGYRSGHSYSPSSNADRDELAAFQGQLAALTTQLERITRTVHPTERNYRTFGHEIRNVLILACTEVEAQWRGILLANGMSKERFATNDYVRLCEAMRLNEYEVGFFDYPWIVPIRPFEQWRTDAPARTIGWYDAYNQVKHDRANSFSRATLQSALEAVSACAIMQCAAFGMIGLGRNAQFFFDIQKQPEWPFSEYYLPIYGHGDWRPQKYPLQ